MTLTREQETIYLERFKNYIWKQVNEFLARGRSNSEFLHVDVDDLYQECCIVFLNALRKADDEQSFIEKLPARDMLRAMCNHVLGMQALTVPKRTTDFRKKLALVSSMTSRPSELDYERVLVGETQNSFELAEMQMDFCSFLSTLSFLEQQVIEEKLHGLKNREIAIKLHLQDSKVSRMLSKCAEKYKAFMAA